MGSDEARHFCKVRDSVCVCSERVPHLLPFLFVGVGPYVIWETAESTGEEFDLKLHNRSRFILSVQNADLFMKYMVISKPSTQSCIYIISFLKKQWHG